MGSNAQQRAIRRIVGTETDAIFIAVPAGQVYVLDIAVPVNMSIKTLVCQLTAGTCTVNLQTVTVAGAATSVTGMNAIAATTSRLSTAAPSDGTEFVAALKSLQITLSAIAGAANLALSVTLQRT